MPAPPPLLARQQLHQGLPVKSDTSTQFIFAQNSHWRSDSRTSLEAPIATQPAVMSYKKKKQKKINMKRVQMRQSASLGGVLRSG